MRANDGYGSLESRFSRRLVAELAIGKASRRERPIDDILLCRRSSPFFRFLSLSFAFFRFLPPVLCRSFSSIRLRFNPLLPEIRASQNEKKEETRMKREEKREHQGYRDLLTKRTPDIRRSTRFFFNVQNVLSAYVSPTFDQITVFSFPYYR